MQDRAMVFSNKERLLCITEKRLCQETRLSQPFKPSDSIFVPTMLSDSQLEDSK